MTNLCIPSTTSPNFENVRRRVSSSVSSDNPRTKAFCAKSVGETERTILLTVGKNGQHHTVSKHEFMFNKYSQVNNCSTVTMNGKCRSP